MKKTFCDMCGGQTEGHLLSHLLSDLDKRLTVKLLIAQDGSSVPLDICRSCEAAICAALAEKLAQQVAPGGPEVPR